MGTAFTGVHIRHGLDLALRPDLRARHGKRDGVGSSVCVRYDSGMKTAKCGVRLAVAVLLLDIIYSHQR